MNPCKYLYPYRCFNQLKKSYHYFHFNVVWTSGKVTSVAQTVVCCTHTCQLLGVSQVNVEAKDNLFYSSDNWIHLVLKYSCIYIFFLHMRSLKNILARYQKCINGWVLYAVWHWQVHHLPRFTWVHSVGLIYHRQGRSITCKFRLLRTLVAGSSLLTSLLFANQYRSSGHQKSKRLNVP